MSPIGLNSLNEHPCANAVHPSLMDPLVRADTNTNTAHLNKNTFKSIVSKIFMVAVCIWAAFTTYKWCLQKKPVITNVKEVVMQTMPDFLIPFELHTIFTDEIFLTYSKYLADYDKHYETAEEYLERFHIFKNNVQNVRMFNTNTVRTYDQAINEFTDWREDELKQLSCIDRNPSNVSMDMETFKPNGLYAPLPITFDWRLHQCGVAAYNQGYCGSCWAFAATESIERRVCVKYGAHVKLSPQQMVDCDTSSGGCHGGAVEYGLQYASKNGMCEISQYPYRAKQLTCNDKNCRPHVKVTKMIRIPRSVNAVKQALIQLGPLPVIVNADPFHRYSSGIITSKDCKPALNHGVLLIGWGYDISSHTPYWIVRNSWGEKWGENGTARLKMESLSSGSTDTCGILTNIIVPDVELL